ncbi:hypothetical protein ACFVAO_24700, partial [Streptomyces californicus]
MAAGKGPGRRGSRTSGGGRLGRPVHRIARLGIGRTFQTATVFEQLTVLQNLDIAAGAGRPVRTHLRDHCEPVRRRLGRDRLGIGLWLARDADRALT